MLGLLTAIFAAILIPTAMCFLMCGIRIATVGEQTYKTIQRYRQHDYVMDVYMKYLFCRIDKVTLRQELNSYISAL